MEDRADGLTTGLHEEVRVFEDTVGQGRSASRGGSGVSGEDGSLLHVDATC